MVRLTRSGLGNGSGTQAAGTKLDRLHLAFVQRSYLLEVWVPYLPGLVLSMTDIIAGRRSLTTYLTNSGHFENLLEI